MTDDSRTEARDTFGEGNAEIPPQDPLADLSELVALAVARYKDLATQEPPVTTKGMASYQSACRAALAHVEQLLHLARMQSGATDQEFSHDLDSSLAGLLGEARSAIDARDGEWDSVSADTDDPCA